VGQKVRPDTKCSRRLEDFLQLPSKASTNLGASHMLVLSSLDGVIVVVIDPSGLLNWLPYFL